MPQTPLNLYGDTCLPTTGEHGTDIATQRRDALDEACLTFAQEILRTQKECRALDVGGGAGAQSVALATIGCDVLLLDLSDQTDSIAQLNQALPHKICFLQQDIRAFSNLSDPWDIVYMQRMIHYLPYAQALQVLTNLRAQATDQARFFLSSSGLTSELGHAYADAAKPVATRWAPLAAPMAHKHGIHAPVCLYAESELKNLVQQAGLTVRQSWISTFGNPKLIATHAA